MFEVEIDKNSTIEINEKTKGYLKGFNVFCILLGAVMLYTFDDISELKAYIYWSKESANSLHQH